jgi:hypothetical protein
MPMYRTHLYFSVASSHAAYVEATSWVAANSFRQAKANTLRALRAEYGNALPYSTLLGHLALEVPGVQAPRPIVFCLRENTLEYSKHGCLEVTLARRPRA